MESILGSAKCGEQVVFCMGSEECGVAANMSKVVVLRGSGGVVALDGGAAGDGAGAGTFGVRRWAYNSHIHLSDVSDVNAML
ncbi:unnamed protein product [Hydatigera taeniaeformis]|uniref:SpoU_methylase domain-containing protein n=1 Tax=Hydatigena taeniaeformis TaxID=6205 RepID=A0A0R3WM14_HYDTA|nr:unnamed protein product [Hydatigera taeniaeformis]